MFKYGLFHCSAMGDVKKVLGEIMKDSNSIGSLGDSGMWDSQKKEFKPVSSYRMVFDSQQAQLEPIYYWVLDFVQDFKYNVEKMEDNFTASPGSAQFAELGQRATKLQEEGMKILGGLNQVVKSVLNLIYDLKEFEIRLAHYDDAKSSDPQKKEAGMLALKQIWLDNVDMKRGRGAIHQMAAELGYTTLREVFMMANSIEDLKKMNSEDGGGLINDQVLRILIPRISEFLKWIDYSESELRKRMKIEVSYLRTQVDTIKLYSQWMKPYLKSADELRQKGFDGNAALVNAFSTSMFELVLFATGKETSPPGKYGSYNMKRKYFPCMVLTLKYRGHVSQRVTQKGDYGYAMGGRVEMIFDSYALNNEEIELMKKKMKAEDVADSLNFSGDVAAESLDTLKQDLDHFLNDELGTKKEEEKKKAEQKAADVNPFSALFDVFFKKKKDSKEEKKEIKDTDDIKADNYIEKAAREIAARSASDNLYKVYDIYKKSHGMASAPGAGFENTGLTGTDWDKKIDKGPKVRARDTLRGGFDKF